MVVIRIWNRCHDANETPFVWKLVGGWEMPAVLLSTSDPGCDSHVFAKGSRLLTKGVLTNIDYSTFWIYTGAGDAITWCYSKRGFAEVTDQVAKIDGTAQNVPQIHPVGLRKSQRSSHGLYMANV